MDTYDPRVSHDISISGDTFEELVPKIRAALAREWVSIGIGYGIEEHRILVLKMGDQFGVFRLNMRECGTGPVKFGRCVVGMKCFDRVPTVDQLRLS